MVGIDGGGWVLELPWGWGEIWGREWEGVSSMEDSRDLLRAFKQHYEGPSSGTSFGDVGVLLSFYIG